MKRYLIVALLVALPAGAHAQEGDRTYCIRLGYLAAHYIGSSGAQGGIEPDLNILGAIDDCNKGRTDKAIPYLEKRLRCNHITIPART